ncbi:MAG: hypothetical protein ACYS47_10495 [Planctomycetota bacterium]|jgi:hypothetical protein
MEPVHVGTGEPPDEKSEGVQGLALGRPKLGWILIVIGVIGVITGVVPFITNGLRIVVDEDLWNVVDLADHGVEAMGLTVEWGMLSSAMGMFLGFLLLWAGVGWLRAAHWAPTVTVAYVICGLTVNFTDMIIFLFRAKHGAMRTQMLVLDSIAFVIPLTLAVMFVIERRRE